jgi:hypothetical protein
MQYADSNENYKNAFCILLLGVNNDEIPNTVNLLDIAVLRVLGLEI